MTRITGLGMKRSYKDAQFNTLFESGEQEAITETGGHNLNESEEGQTKKKRKRSKYDPDGVQMSPSVERGVGESKKWGKQRFAGKFSGAKTNGASRCSHA